ncbi:PTS sugar transporter, partial [Salmonella enterica]|nr:PTS sugar transporter [Salmonella enterica subsp. enterica serovar Lille]
MLSFITVECVLEVRMKRHYIFASHGTLASGVLNS